MAKLYRERAGLGFTLVELLIVLAVLAILAGVVLSAAGPARERARQGVCIAHLRQIGQAVAMYQADYGGSDAPGWPAQMGLPPTPVALIGLLRPGGGRYPLRDGVLFCPDHLDRGLAASSYGWNVWGPWTRFDSPDVAPIPGSIEPFPTAVARRGAEFPLAYDVHHNHPDRSRPPSGSQFVIVLHLDSSVRGKWTAAEQSWNY